MTVLLSLKLIEPPYKSFEWYEKVLHVSKESEWGNEKDCQKIAGGSLFHTCFELFTTATSELLDITNAVSR